MKKSLSVILSLALLLALAACGGGQEETPFDPAADSETLLESGCFSGEMTGIDLATACALYGIDQSTVSGGAVYGSAGVTGEELAILTFQSAEDAQAALKQLQYRVEDQLEVLSDYAPDAVPRLEGAVVTARGASALLVVADDYGPVETFLGG